MGGAHLTGKTGRRPWEEVAYAGAMTIPASLLRRVVTPSKQSPLAVSKDDARRILEIACLAVASDGKLTNEELAALRVLSAEIPAFPKSELESLVNGCMDLKLREDRTERLRVAADALSTEGARHLAYKLSVAVALADMASADEEFEFDLDIQDALKLPPDTADRLAGDVHEALMPDDA